MLGWFAGRPSTCPVFLSSVCVVYCDHDSLCAELVDKAQDPLDLDENYVIQQLTSELPAKFDVVNK